MSALTPFIPNKAQLDAIRDETGEGRHVCRGLAIRRNLNAALVAATSQCDVKQLGELLQAVLCLVPIRS